MIHSIRWRLVASYVLLTLLTTSVVGVLALTIIRHYVQQQEAEDLRANAQAIARQAYPLMWSPLPQPELSQLVETAAFLGSVRVRILDEAGRTLADSGLPGEEGELVWILSPLGEDLLPGEVFNDLQLMVLANRGMSRFTEREPDFLEELPPGTSLTVVQRTSGAWGSRFSFFTPHRTGNTLEESLSAELPAPRSAQRAIEPIGESGNPAGFVELSAAPDFGAEALETTRRALLFAGAGALLVAGLVGLWMSHRLTSPLRSLREATGRMGAGDLSARAPLRSKDEIGELAAQFNQMAEQLEGSFRQLAAERDALRRFIADASHELRTPITALKNFNALLMGPAASDPRAQAEFLSESQAQIDRLEWITSDLLDLSRLEAGLLELAWDEHDVREVLTSASAPFRAVAGERGIWLTVSQPASPLHVWCDRARLEIALANLLDNALKFTPPGGQVELSAERSEAGVRMWVRDTGAGIDPQDLPQIFERFYRGRGHTVPGSGLGLSIVERIVQAMGGNLSAESVPGEGSRFTIELPEVNNNP